MATRTTLNTEQETLWYLGNLRIIQAIGEQAGRAVHLIEYVLPAGTHIYPHRHRDEDEGVYVAQGEATFSCGEKVQYFLHVRADSSRTGGGFHSFTPMHFG